MTERLDASIDRALGAYGLRGAEVEPLGAGLINLTFRVSAADGRCFALQRLHPVFPAEVNRDIDRVTRRLEEAGLVTPRVVPTGSGALWVDADDGPWRLLTLVPGVTRDTLSGADEAFRAGRLLGRFHRALDGLDHHFANPRLGVHDTARHLALLRRALTARREHPRFSELEPLAGQILGMAAALPPLPATPDRVVHGDPKINNMLFDAKTGEAVAMIDLDTVGLMPLPLELGDAFRSWCNPAGENERSGVFSAELFRAGLEGYVGVTAGWLRADESAAIVPATLRIIVELASRFCADALNESYFHWDPRRFASRSEHNQVRAAGQLTLARSLSERYEELAALAGRICG